MPPENQPDGSVVVRVIVEQAPPAEKPKPKSTSGFVMAVVWVSLFVSCVQVCGRLGSDSTTSAASSRRSTRAANAAPAPEARSPMAVCVERGIQYYKDIDAYPRLSTTGERVEDVVKRRCSRTTGAFGP